MDTNKLGPKKKTTTADGVGYWFRNADSCVDATDISKYLRVHSCSYSGPFVVRFWGWACSSSELGVACPSICDHLRLAFRNAIRGCYFIGAAIECRP
jgi:hypothetical protein